MGGHCPCQPTAHHHASFLFLVVFFLLPVGKSRAPCSAFFFCFVLSERGIWEREMEFGCAWASGPVGLTDGTARALHSPRKTLGQGGPLRY